MFKKCKSEQEIYESFAGNYSTLSGYYEIESSRRMGDYEGMDQLLNHFKSENLDNENHLTQLEIYPFWTALLRQSWRRIFLLGDSWREKNIPPNQRAQILYCEALAIKSTRGSQETMHILRQVIVESRYSEPELIENAFEMALEILWDEIQPINKSADSEKSVDLLEACSMAKVWNDSVKKSRELPEKYRVLLGL